MEGMIEMTVWIPLWICDWCYSFNYINSTCLSNTYLLHILIKVFLCTCRCVRFGEYCSEEEQGLCPNRAHNLWKDCLLLGGSDEVWGAQWSWGPERRWGMRVDKELLK